VLPWCLALHLCRCRTRNARLPIHFGLYSGLERSERLCTLCKSHEMSDEFHYIFKCSHLNSETNIYTCRYCLSNYYSWNPNVLSLNSFSSFCKYVPVSCAKKRHLKEYHHLLFFVFFLTEFNIEQSIIFQMKTPFKII
jgi:hypothetical protein